MKKNIPYKVTTETGEEKIVYDGRYACVTGIVIAVEENTSYILANKRGPGCPTNVGLWNMPCGFMDAGSAEENAAREVYEETGCKISPDKFNFIGIGDTAKNRNVILRYVAILNEGRQEILTPEQLKGLGGEEDEVSEIKWIDARSINKYKWAYNHNNVIYQLLVNYKLLPKEN